MRFPKNAIALTLAGLMGAAMPFAVSAQAQQDAPSAQDVTSTEIEAFALAYQSVFAIEQQFAPRIAEAAPTSASRTLCVSKP